VSRSSWYIFNAINFCWAVCFLAVSVYAFINLVLKSFHKSGLFLSIGFCALVVSSLNKSTWSFTQSSMLGPLMSDSAYIAWKYGTCITL